MWSDIVLAAVLVATSVASALSVLMIVHVIARRGAMRQPPGLFDLPDDDAAFLFDEEDLVDASDAGQALLSAVPGEGTHWARLAARLSPRFPDFARRISELGEKGEIEMHADDGSGLILRAEWRSGLARIALHDPSAEGRFVAVDKLSHDAAEDELRRLRRLLEQLPLPVWCETRASAVTWANPAYLALASARDADAGVLTWPLPRLFATEGDGHGWSRRPIETKGGTRWFECALKPQDDGGVNGFALPADGAVRAEAALADFVQTLTRTFANLPVGLAIFDRRRRLQLFNPALTDLTTLRPEFLSGRPTLEDFFDALRACRMIPEPRDYRSWRDGLTEVEKAAAEGQYDETWPLPTGQTYRVIGRPHADGAVAFLIEDITAEISLTRRFRAEIETGQAVLDSLSDAIGVFSAAGVLVMSNTAYARLWAVEPDAQLGGAGLAEAIEGWQSLAHPGPHWNQLRTLIGAGGPRQAWEGAVQLRDGRHLACRLTPLTGGATMVAFAEAAGRGDAPGPAVSGPLSARTGSDSVLPGSGVIRSHATG